MSFAASLRDIRLQRGLTQVEIAKQLGVDKSTYNGYESGRREPDVKRIKEIARILNVSADYLIGTQLDDITHIRPLIHTSDQYVDAINNREEIEELLRMAVSCSTDDVWRILKIWKIIMQPKSGE